MCERGLIRKPRRRWTRTKNSNHSHRVYPNMVKNLAVTGPNQSLVSDITHIGIHYGLVYLAVILDLFSRLAIGYAVSSNIDTALCLEALRMAIADRHPPEGIRQDHGIKKQASQCNQTNSGPLL